MHVKISHVIRPIEMLENGDTQVGKIYDGEAFKVSGSWDSMFVFFTGNRGSMIFFRREPGLDDFCHREPRIDDFSDREPGILTKMGHRDPGMSEKSQRVAGIESLRMSQCQRGAGIP